MTKSNQQSDYYDQMFAKGGFEGVYDLPYSRSAYFPLFKAVLRELRRIGTSTALEVGCGTGGFAHLLLESSSLVYRGFDFSTVAVERARARTKRPDLFYVGDATKAESYKADYDTVVCTEVLEHIEQDLEAIHRWRRGCKCVCSIPNFDAESHVRFFRTEEEVQTRYGVEIQIERIVRVKKPVLSDTSLRSYLRAIRWNRYRPRQLLEILGLGSFEQLGGWFLFSGTRR